MGTTTDFFNGNLPLIFEWSGAILGLLGALLLALNIRVSRYGWILFLAANIAMIAFALQIQARGLLLQQIGFVITSTLGLYRAGFFPGAIAIKQKLGQR